MDYSEADIRRAFLADEVSRLQTENSGMFAFTGSRVPSYGTAVADPEPTAADIDDDTVDTALSELASQRGLSLSAVSEAVTELTGGLRDTQSRAMAVIELAAMPEDEAAALVELAAKSKGKKPLYDDEDEEDDEDEDDLSEHMSENQGNQGPKPKPGKGKKRKPVQVKRRGQSPFGSEGGAPEGGAGPSGGEMAASAPRRRLVRAGYGYETVALSEDQAWADGEVARLAQEHPRVGLSAPAFDTPNDLGGVHKYFDFDVYDVGARDDGDPTDPDGGDTDAIIARLQRDHNQYFSPSKTYGANRRGKLAGKYPGTGPSGKPQNIAS